MVERGDTGIEVVAVNDVMSPESMAHLLRYDSTYGTWREAVSATGDQLRIGDRTLRLTQQREPAALDWGGVGAEVVVESTGRFRVLSAPARAWTRPS